MRRVLQNSLVMTGVFCMLWQLQSVVVVSSFQIPCSSTTRTSRISTTTCSPSALHLAKSRQTKRSKKVDKSRPQTFYDAIEDAGVAVDDKLKKEKQPDSADDTIDDDEAAATARQARMDDAQRRMDQRPDVSTMIVDDETGIEVVAQGKAVMDVVTRQAVKLSDLGPDYRLAQLFPGVPSDVMEQYRFKDWKSTTVPDMVQQLRDACSVKLADGSRGIPAHPSIANKAIDFCLANRDYLGYKMKRTLGRITMRSLSQRDKDQALQDQKLWKNFMTLENHISAPFRQMIMDGEGRVGPNFGNLDIASYCSGELYERCANYLVLKAMVAHWEKKVVDAHYIEETPQTKENYMTVLSRGDPKRYLPDPPILFTLRECTQVCFMAQQMAKAFCETPALFDDLPPEVRFLEAALSIQGGTALRKFMMDEFCPNENISPSALRQGMRRLLAQLENMQIDPYGDLVNLLERLCTAMALGTDDEYDPYQAFLTSKDPNGPGAFQSYTFDAEPLSRVRFLDAQYERSGVTEKGVGGRSSGGGIGIGGGGGGFFNFGGVATSAAPKKETESASATKAGEPYKVPQLRAIGRPHELGWLDLLKDETRDNAEELRLGKVPPGQILVQEE